MQTCPCAHSKAWKRVIAASSQIMVHYSRLLRPVEHVVHFPFITISALYCFGEKFGKICTLRVCKERNHWLLRDAVQFLQCFALPVNSRSKVVLMRDHNNEDKRADHPLYRNHWLQPLGRRGDEYGMNHERNMCAKNGTRVSGAKKQ